MELPLVSIITVVYNGEKYLEKTIQSVLEQTYANIEYIIIDGGSTDGTLDIIKKYEKYIAYWVSEPDKGLYDAMNKGISVAKGELIGMINSDDWYELNAVEVVIKKFLVTNKKVYHGNVYLVNEDSTRVLRKFNPSKLKFLLYGMTYLHPTFFVTKDMYKKILYNTEIKSLSDYQFCLEVYNDNKNNFEYLDCVISNFRVGGISGSLSLRQRLYEGYIVKKEAKMNLFMNIVSLLIRLLIFSVFYIRRKIKFLNRK